MHQSKQHLLLPHRSFLAEVRNLATYDVPLPLLGRGLSCYFRPLV
jgi:hypothetical protein